MGNSVTRHPLASSTAFTRRPLALVRLLKWAYKIMAMKHWRVPYTITLDCRTTWPKGCRTLK